ncbi:MAG: UDP-N-acetylmuramoyl-L-alanine--D-glutamate ligase [Fimbriimonadaceae bacterium]
MSARRHVAVFGLGRSGRAVVDACRRLGQSVVAYDEKASPSLDIDVEVRAPMAQTFSPDEVEVIVVNPAVPMRHSLLQRAVADRIPVWSEIEFAYRVANAPIVAITGTNGKSTTTVLTYLALQASHSVPVLCGNIYGSGFEEQPLTAAAMNAQPHHVLVAEVSSFQLEWVSRFRPRAATITNIGLDHLDRYLDAREYAETKLRIFSAMQPDDIAVVHRKFPISATGAARRVMIGAHDDIAWLDEEYMHLSGKKMSRSELISSSDLVALNMTYAGALALAVDRELDLVHLMDGFKRFRGLSHRMETVGQKDGITVINNSMCTNPEAVMASSRSLRSSQHLLIGGVRKDLDFTDLGRYLQESGHKAYLFGQDARLINDQMGGAHPVFATMQEAFEAALSASRPGEFVMLAPGAASKDQFEDFRDRGNQFKTMAESWMNR